MVCSECVGANSCSLAFLPPREVGGAKWVWQSCRVITSPVIHVQMYVGGGCYILAPLFITAAGWLQCVTQNVCKSGGPAEQ